MRLSCAFTQALLNESLCSLSSVDTQGMQQIDTLFGLRTHVLISQEEVAATSTQYQIKIKEAIAKQKMAH